MLPWRQWGSSFRISQGFFLCLLLADQDVSDQFSAIMDSNLLERQAQLNAFMPWCFVTIEE